MRACARPDSPRSRPRSPLIHRQVDLVCRSPRRLPIREPRCDSRYVQANADGTRASSSRSRACSVGPDSGYARSFIAARYAWPVRHLEHTALCDIAPYRVAKCPLILGLPIPGSWLHERDVSRGSCHRAREVDQSGAVISLMSVVQSAYDMRPAFRTAGQSALP